MAELVDALDSNSSGLGRAGSIPALGTKTPDNIVVRGFVFCGGQNQNSNLYYIHLMELHSSLQSESDKFTNQGENTIRNHDLHKTYNHIIINIGGDFNLLKYQFDNEVEIRCQSNVMFQNCVFIHGLSFTDQTNGAIEFYDCFFLGKINFNKNNNGNLHVKFINCSIENSETSLVINIGNVFISNCNFKVVHCGKNAKSLEIIDNLSHQFDEVNVLNSTLTSLTINKSKISSLNVQDSHQADVSISQSDFDTIVFNNHIGRVKLESNKIGNLISNDNIDKASLNILDGNEITLVEINSFSGKNILIDNSVIKELTLFTIKSKEDILISKIEQLELVEIYGVMTQLRLSDLTLNKLSIKEMDCIHLTGQ